MRVRALGFVGLVRNGSLRTTPPAVVAVPTVVVVGPQHTPTNQPPPPPSPNPKPPPQAIVENLDVKIPFYKQLGGLVKPGAIFGSNTSSLRIADFARPSGRPEKFVSGDVGVSI